MAATPATTAIKSEKLREEERERQQKQRGRGKPR
jgi:hypothetical protein